MALRDRHAEEPGVAQQRHGVPRILLGAVDLGGTRLHGPLRDLTRLALQGALLRREVEVHFSTVTPFQNAM